MDGSEHSQSVRRFTSRNDNLTRYLGEIERLVYAAEIICPNENQIQTKDCETCPAYGIAFCKVKLLRKVIGDNFVHSIDGEFQ